jgi:hypothetical protein
MADIAFHRNTFVSIVLYWIYILQNTGIPWNIVLQEFHGIKYSMELSIGSRVNGTGKAPATCA